VYVGAATETEMKEKKARVEDALHATRAAVEEGIVPGGGTALIRAIPALEELRLKGDEAIGAEIVKRALEEPLRQLADNAGWEGSLVVQELKARKGWKASTWTSSNTWTWARRASSTRRRSPVPPCNTRRALPVCC